MLNNGNKTNCGFANEIVSYIYVEIGAAERTKFETHLANCAVCTDEFAAVSNARFSVFEWQKEEFANLATPEIVIPYAPKKTVDEEDAPVGFLAGLRGLLSLVNLPVAVAAGLFVFLGIGFLAMNYLGRGGQQIASNIGVPPIQSHNTPVVLPTDDTKTPEVAVTISSPNKSIRQEVRPVKAVEHRRSRIERQVTAKNSVDRNSTPNIPNAPILSNYEENDDNSLRLAELFDNIGG